MKHIKDMESTLFGFTGAQLRKIAFQFAELNYTTAARARAFNEVSVAAFIDILEFTPDRIINVDRLGFQLFQIGPHKKGDKRIAALFPAERGQLVTVEICLSAA
ncbi:MAG: hypothetical protein M3H12_19505, partial [Chromatiales bacterium]